MISETVLFVGYGKLPEDIPAGTVYNKVGIGIGIEVNIDTGYIVNVSCTLPSKLAQDIVCSCIQHYNINKDFKEIINNIKRRYQGEAQKAIIIALDAVHKKYVDYMHKVKTGKL